jgi:hypothetical protein
LTNAKLNKEYLYVGHYIDDEGNYILKVGTTNDLEREEERSIPAIIIKPRTILYHPIMSLNMIGI